MNEKPIEIIANECVLLKRLIEEKNEELKNLKSVLKDKMELTGRRVIRGDSYKIKQQFYKSQFFSVLGKEFCKLNAGTINSLLQSELVKERKSVSYLLDTARYQAINEANEDSLVDAFVRKRKERSAITIYSL